MPPLSTRLAACLLLVALPLSARAENPPEDVPNASTVTGSAEEGESASATPKPGSSDQPPQETEPTEDPPVPSGAEPAPAAETPRPSVPSPTKAPPLSIPPEPESSEKTPTTEVVPASSRENPSRTVDKAVGTPAATDKTSSTPDADGFVSLLGPTGLTGWVVQEGRPNAWVREDDMISCVAAGGGWLRTEKEYSDFQLKLEYRLTPGANTGIGIRSPAEGNPTFTGMEIQLLDDDALKYKDLRADQYSGSIYYQVPCGKKAVLKPAGEWNTCEIQCAGDSLVITINGEEVNRVHLVHAKDSKKTGPLPEHGYSLAQRPPIGHISLQSHTSRVDFRNIRLKDLAQHTPSGLQYVDLEVGEGDAVADHGTVTLHYVGQLTDGKRFSDTRDVGPPVQVPLSDVIAGMREGISGMKVGGRRRLIVPPSLGYGSTGAGNLIPPGATLVFEVELCGFQR